MAKSEFGKGLIICLVKFAEHAMEFQHTLEHYEKARIESEGNLFSESSAVGIWANGASDHLYDIEVPEGKDWEEVKEKVEELRKEGLNMGHGDGLMGRKRYTSKDVTYLIGLTREIALMVDKKIGLEPDLGEW